jgi:hypothetical protein
MKTRLKKILRAIQGWLPMTLIVLGSLWLLQATLARTSGHGVLIKGLDYNAGSVKTGTTISQTMSIVNLSTKSVEVDALPSCGCTVVNEPLATVAPFHATTFTARVNTAEMLRGPQRRTVAIWLRSGRRRWTAISTMRFRIE